VKTQNATNSSETLSRKRGLAHWRLFAGLLRPHQQHVEATFDFVQKSFRPSIRRDATTIRRTCGWDLVRGVCLVEEANDFVSQQANEGRREHGLRDVGVFEVVVRLSDHFQ